MNSKEPTFNEYIAKNATIIETPSPEHMNQNWIKVRFNDGVSKHDAIGYIERVYQKRTSTFDNYKTFTVF